MAADEQTQPAPWIVAGHTPPAERTFAQRVQVWLMLRLAFAMFELWHYRPHRGRICLLCAEAIPGMAPWFGQGALAICEACFDAKPPAMVLAPFYRWPATGAHVTPAELEQAAAEALRRHEAQEQRSYAEAVALTTGTAGQAGQGVRTEATGDATMRERDRGQVALEQLSFWSGGGGQRVTGTGTWTATGAADSYAATTRTQAQQEQRAEQAAELARVSKSIADHVLYFCRGYVGRRFHVNDLREYVVTRALVAPASPDRILRQLRQRGLIAYRVISRAKSEYEVVAVREEGKVA